MAGFAVAEGGRVDLPAAQAPPEPTRLDHARWFVADHPATDGIVLAIVLALLAGLWSRAFRPD